MTKSCPHRKKGEAMKIDKLENLPGGLVEVTFTDGTRSQYREEDLGEGTVAPSPKPEDFRTQIKEKYAQDKGVGQDDGAGKEKE